MLNEMRKKLLIMSIKCGFLYRRARRKVMLSCYKVVILVKVLRYHIVKQCNLWLAPNDETRQQILRKYERLEITQREKNRIVKDRWLRAMHLLAEYLEGTREAINAVGCKYGINGVFAEAPEDEIARAPEDFKQAKGKMLISMRWLYDLCPGGFVEEDLLRLEELKFEDFDTTPEIQKELIDMLLRIPNKSLGAIESSVNH